MDATDTARQKPGVPTSGYRTVVELGKPDERESRRQGRERKMKGREMRIFKAAKLFCTYNDEHMSLYICMKQ